MAWNTTKPVTTNQILEDVPDIQENLDWLKDIVTANVPAWDGSTAANNIFSIKPRVAKTANYTATAADTYIECNTSGGAFTLTLPTAATKAGQHFIIKLATAGNPLTIATDGTETIDSADQFALNFTGEILEIIADGTNWQIIRWHFPRKEQRAKFRWKDGDEIYIGGAVYRIPGGQYEYVYWNSEITFVLQSSGSNAASSDYGADAWHYIYIDDSAVDTQNTPLLDADCFLNSTTAPTWDDDKKGWYNSADRCIFAVYETGSAILEFWHDGGDLIMKADQSKELSASAIAAAWGTTTTHVVPAFARKIQVTVTVQFVDATVSIKHLFWREGSSSAATGHEISLYRYSTADGSYMTYNTNTTAVFCNTSLQVDWQVDAAAAGIDWDINTNGWFLPMGM